MRLFIAEKPQLARAIVDGLGGGQKKDSYYECADGDKVTWCVGHMLELCNPVEYDAKYTKWNLSDLPFYYYPVKLKVKFVDKELDNHLIRVRSLIAKAKHIVHAGDPDREGQLIVDQLLSFCNYDGKVERFKTNNNNIDLVKKALKNMTDNLEHKKLSDAGFARQIADQLFGFNMTMALTAMYKNQGGNGTVNVGRVQTPILALVVNRTLANMSHKKSHYYVIKGKHESGLIVTYCPPDSFNLNEKGNMLDEAQAKGKFNQLLHKKYKVSAIEVSHSKQSAPLPFNIINLQIACAKALGMSPTKVMQVTQSLRENHDLISYNGTDCCYLNEVDHQDAPMVFAAVFSYLGDLTTKGFDVSYKGKCFNDTKVSAHHGIIPTGNLKCNFAKLSKDELAVYKLIANQYLIQFYPPAQYTEKKLQITSGDDHFSSTFKHYTHLSFLAVTNPNSSIIDGLVDLAVNDSFPLFVELNKNNTAPAKLYTYDTLLKDFTHIAKYVVDENLRAILIKKDEGLEGEKGGIGTPRTRDGFIAELIKNGMIVKKGKSLIASEKAILLITTLPKSVTQPDMSALWHEQLMQIESGKLSIENFLDYVFAFIDIQIKSFKTEGFDFNVILPDCPKCVAKLKQLYSTNKNAYFWACSADNCAFTCDDKKGLPVFS